MKKFYSTLFLTGGILFFHITIHSQSLTDPFTGKYKIGGSAELFLSYATVVNEFNYQIVNSATTNLNSIEPNGTPFTTLFFKPRLNASTMGDFNGDNADEVVFISNNEKGGLKITIPVINKSLEIDNQIDFNTSFSIDTLQRIRICSGNFDTDSQDEFAICYGPVNKTIVISVFETDSVLNINLLYSNSTYKYSNPYFDITSGDTDGDGIDEIVFINDMTPPAFTSSGAIVTSNYDLKILSYKPADKVFITTFGEDISIDNIRKPTEWLNHGNILLEELRISCGDIDGDCVDEIVTGWAVSYCWAIEPWRYRDMEFLNVFKRRSSGKIDNITNTCASYSEHNRYQSTTAQHLALSLKCENLMGAGKDDIIINGLSELCVFAYDGTTKALKKKGSTALNFDIKSNEAFAIADLDPDTANLDFKKEIVAIVSDINVEYQIREFESTTKMQILIIDTINSDIVEFKKGTPQPINRTEGEFTVMAFNAGDLDLTDASMYFVGKPVYFKIEDIQEPIVILNAPPVHFDLIDNTVYDLCNAFTGDSEDFYASYKTTDEHQNSTSVENNNTYGMSNELNSYAFAGGNGFSFKLKNNWDKGKTYYNSVCKNITVSQTNNLYIENYVLASVLNYGYYKYPVYNKELECIGNIAIMSPESTQQLRWIDGKDWDNSSYLFNNEVGNVLSYKPYEKLQDFSVDQPDFFKHTYFSLDISNSESCKFEFFLSDITNTDTSYSLKSSTGRDYFIKAGIEASVSVETDFIIAGTSVSTDIKIGVSDNLSRNFSNSGLSTHKTMLSKSFEIDGYLGKLAKIYNSNAQYQVTPYIYRSQCGALVLDYMVNIEPDKMEFWKENYSQKADFAFIQPWRYTEEKGEGEVKLSQKQKTSDIQFFPAIVSAGDTVTVVVRVHNYSLKTFDSTLTVDFYLKDPANGGIKLEDIGGKNRVEKQCKMTYNAPDATIDNEEFIAFNWKVPDTITCSPRIYAVIDPDSTTDEIHENNNIGWNKLPIYGCNDCQYEEPASQVELTNINQSEFEIFPNPFKDVAYINFYLQHPEIIQVDLFDISGQYVYTLTNQIYQAGNNIIRINPTDLDKGIYFCRITTENSIKTIKLICSN